MPELPEVETVRRGLEAQGLDRPVRSVWRSRFDLRTGAHWVRALEGLTRLQGLTPGRIDRRGKYLLWEFASPQSGPWTLLIHLGMTGQCSVGRVGESRPAHTHFVLGFADDRRFCFADARRFGGLRVDRRAALEASRPLAELGPEPLDEAFDGATLAKGLGRSARALREGLLDQRAVAGIGNIYASEICFAAGIDPRVACRRLRASAWSRIAAATRACLEGSLSRGGTTLRDYRKVDGGRGENAGALAVYGRAEAPCHRCGTAIEQGVAGGRSFFWCSSCQPKPKGRWIS